MAGEIGQNTCAHDYIDKVMNWADANGVGYLAWTWNAWGACDSSGNVLITADVLADGEHRGLQVTVRAVLPEADRGEQSA
ncbi:hypothetical protein ABZ860_34570 [Microbispora sp. NPDC046973]|uniref:hypothetical protein n=1 Tax=Microbispora sp. NPDC046973 TaxID=3155022 RepID=UPI0033DF54EE